MSTYIMFGMSEEHGRFLYELAKKEIESIDIVFDKVKHMDGLEWLQNRRKIAEESKEILSIVNYP